jgi:hypothetical protein
MAHGLHKNKKVDIGKWKSTFLFGCALAAHQCCCSNTETKEMKNRNKGTISDVVCEEMRANEGSASLLLMFLTLICESSGMAD